MTSNPKVSIIIPVYNGGNYLREAIDSALAQTYRNFEVIVINDGSTDGGITEEIAHSYGDRIRYVSKNNGGVSTALNAGIQLMDGQWFLWLSHDDVISTNRIEEDINLIRNNPEIKATFCQLAYIDQNGELLIKYDYDIEKITNPREAMMPNGVNMCAVTIHKSCFDKVGMFNENNRTTQDVEMTLLLSKHYPLFLNRKSVLYCRDHPERGIHTLKEQQRKDRIMIGNFIKANFCLYDFFPHVDDNDTLQTLEAWNWLGDTYRLFGTYQYADECYYNAYLCNRSLFSVTWLKYILGGKRLDNYIINKLVQLRSIVIAKGKYVV